MRIYSNKSSSIAVCKCIAAVTLALLSGCGGGGGGSSSNNTPAPTGTTYTLSGQVQKGPFSIGTQVTVNELDANLNPTGKVYNVQTTNDLGNFSVSSAIGTKLVEMVGDGFYMDELTGQLAASRIQLRAVVDLSIDSTPTINVLTSLQAQRLKTLISQGSSYAAANTQSQNEVLSALGIDPTKINSLSTLYSMQINGSTDADSVLLATSAIISKMATNAAVTNTSTQPAELSNFISTIASQISSSGAITNPAIVTAKNLAETQINLAAVKANTETYYANRGVTVVTPKFEEWIDKDGSGILPRRLVPVSSLTLTDVLGVEPNQLFTSNTITVSGLGVGIAAPVTVNSTSTDSSPIIIKNGIALSGLTTTVLNGDTLAFRDSSQGYGLTNYVYVSVGSSTTIWHIVTKPLGGTITGLTGSGLVLQNNAGDDITISANATNFSFPSSVAKGTGYNVSVLTYPNTPLQICAVSNGAGTTGAAISNISIACTAPQHVAYVPSIPNGISAYALDPITGGLISIGGGAAGIQPSYMTADPAGRNIYLSHSGGISDFSVSAGSGGLSPYWASPGGVNSVIGFDPTGKFVYITNFNANTVTTYSVDSMTGIFVSPGSVATGAAPNAIGVEPAGKFAYVMNSGTTATGSSISAFSVNNITGALSPIGTFACEYSNTIVFNPNGKYLYLANYGPGSAVGPAGGVSAYSIDANTGSLTLIGKYIPVGSRNYWTVAADLSGKFVYLTGANLVYSYAVDSITGALTYVGSVAVSNPASIALDPTGKFAYVGSGNNNNVSAFSIDAVTGVLTNIGVFASGTSPFYITIVPLQ